MKEVRYFRNVRNYLLNDKALNLLTTQFCFTDPEIKACNYKEIITTPYILA